MNFSRIFLAALLSAAAFAADFPQPFNTEKDMSIPLMPAEVAAAKFQEIGRAHV